MTNLRTYLTIYMSMALKITSVKQPRTHIILLGQAKELPNLGRSLRPQSFRVNSIRQARKLIIALLYNTKSQNGQIHSHNASPNTLSPPLTSSSRSVARMAIAEQQSDTRGVHNALLHRKTLFVVASGDAENIAFEFGANGVTRDFLAHTAVHEDAQFALIVDFDELLGTVCWVGDVELHLDGGKRGVKMMEELWLLRFEVCFVICFSLVRVEAGKRAIRPETVSAGLANFIQKRGT